MVTSLRCLSPAAALAAACLALGACADRGGATDAASDAVTDVASDVALDDAASDAPTPPRDAARDVVCPPALGAARARDGGRSNPHPMDDALRLNQLQSEATHNSYHLRPDNPPSDWDYSHAPLPEQFARQGVRGIELDLQWNAACERFEVFHVPLLDTRSTCRLLTDCLQLVRDWSDAHRGHHPLFIMLEPKGIWRAETIAPRLDALEREILAVFPRELVITPDEVRGSSPTLARAIAERGWPTLGATRGRVLFFLNEEGPVRDVYTRGRTSLDGRLVFAQADATDPFAAVLILNGPVRDQTRIQAAVRAGFLVRTFGETSIQDGMRGDRAGLEAALASGAQIISTDFPVPQPDGGVYFVEMPMGTPSRCNPLVAPRECTPAAVEDPARLATP